MRASAAADGQLISAISIWRSVPQVVALSESWAKAGAVAADKIIAAIAVAMPPDFKMNISSPSVICSPEPSPSVTDSSNLPIFGQQQ